MPHRGAGSIPVHSICCNVFTSFVLFVGLELDLGLWLIFLYYFSLSLSLPPSLPFTLALSLPLILFTHTLLYYDYFVIANFLCILCCFVMPTTKQNNEKNEKFQYYLHMWFAIFILFGLIRYKRMMEEKAREQARRMQQLIAEHQK